MKTQQTEDKTAQITVAQWAVQEFPSYVMNGRLKMLKSIHFKKTVQMCKSRFFQNCGTFV